MGGQLLAIKEYVISGKKFVGVPEDRPRGRDILVMQKKGDCV
jgi:hypothetical protein